MVMISVGIVFINPYSLINFVYYLCLWQSFIFLFHRNESKIFFFAFIVNSALIVVYYLVQTSVYPESYGTTSPLGSWTDDSYFFALVADSIPSGLDVREGFELRDHPYTTLIRSLTFFPIRHPMDVIFFQSGIAAMLVTFSRRFTFQISSDRKLSNLVYIFTLFCPVLMMNGGVILLRDTFVAALFMYSMCSLNSRRFLLTFGAVGLSMMIRPGTALILIFAYIIIFYSELKIFIRRNIVLIYSGAILLLFFGVYFVQLFPDFLGELVIKWTSGGAISFSGRELYEDLTKADDSIFLSIQNSFFLIKAFFGGVYLFLYPFFSIKDFFSFDQFDIRTFAMTLVMPVYSIWLNAWFIAGVLFRDREIKKQMGIVIAMIAVYLLLGTYSLQTRHKTIIQPLYYIIVAIGFAKASQRMRFLGYVLSLVLFFAQVAISLLK
jgi:hypothetical protein